MNASPLVILATLGNRDLQIREADLPPHLKEYFEANNEDTSFQIIRKNLPQGKSFEAITRMLYEERQCYGHLFQFPLLDTVFKEVEERGSLLRKIILCPTLQDPPDKQDTYWVGALAEEYCQQRLGPSVCVEVVPITCDPTHLQPLITFFYHLMDRILKPGDALWVACTGGTPQTRSATQFAGLFRQAEFFTVNARTGQPESETFQVIEKLVLRKIVERMLAVYDYEGIRQLPVPESVRALCAQALRLYNFEEGVEGNTYGQRAICAISLLLENLRICMAQGRYAEALGRLFRLEEAIWHYLFYGFLQEKGLIEPNDILRWEKSEGESEKDKFERLISHAKALASFLKSSFPDYVEERTEGLFYFKSCQNKSCQNKDSIPLASGKNFFWHFFQTLGAYQEVCDFFKELNRDEDGNHYTDKSHFNRLRNKSYLGHGMQKVSQEDVLNILESDVEQFIQKVQRLLNMKPTRRFEEINERIRELLA